MSFFSTEMYPSSETTKMSIGECYNRINSEELIVPGYQRNYVWKKKHQQGYLKSIGKGTPLFGPVINVDTTSGIQYIMDGQNRLMTIYKFIHGDIWYYTDDDEKISFNELPDNEKRKIKNLKISYTETRDWKDEQCQEFFSDSNQGGSKLKDGEFIHSSTNNVFNHKIREIKNEFKEFIKLKSNAGGINIYNDRYQHYEIIGTLINMAITNEYPQRPGKTALQQLKLWEMKETSEILDNACSCVKQCLHKYKELVSNVPSLVEGVKKEEHLRLIYLIYRLELYEITFTEDTYQRFQNILNRINEDRYKKDIILWGTGKNGGVDKIYELYSELYNN